MSMTHNTEFGKRPDLLRLQLICDADLIAREVADMNLDLKRLPLGS